MWNASGPPPPMPSPRTPGAPTGPRLFAPSGRQESGRSSSGGGSGGAGGRRSNADARRPPPPLLSGRSALKIRIRTPRVRPPPGRSVARRLAAMARAAGLEGAFSGHSARVGMARDLVASGASVAAVQIAGRWASARMPAYYARAELAARGAVARFYGG